MRDVCTVPKTPGLCYSSQEEVSVILNDGKIVGKKVLYVSDYRVQKCLWPCRRLLDVIRDNE